MKPLSISARGMNAARARVRSRPAIARSCSATETAEGADSANRRQSCSVRTFDGCRSDSGVCAAELTACPKVVVAASQRAVKAPHRHNCSFTNEKPPCFNALSQRRLTDRFDFIVDWRVVFFKRYPPSKLQIKRRQRDHIEQC